MVGLAAASVAIYLEEQGHPVAAHCFVLSVFAMVAPIAAAIVLGREFQRAWFWVSLLVTASLHGLLLSRMWERLPSMTIPVTAILGTLEMLVLFVVCWYIRQWMSEGQSERS